MGSSAIHVVPDDSFDDWVVRSDNGEVFGHYATREEAELVAQAIARKYGDERSSFTFPTEERPARILQRGGWPDCSGDRTECLDTLSHLDAVDMLARPRQQLRQGHQPRLARNLAAVVYEHQGRYGLDGEALQQFRRRIAVHLDQPHVRLELGCRLFEDRRHRLAGAAPGCPEINQQRNVAVFHVLVEARDTVQCRRPAFAKRPMAGSAFGALA
jgi:hypothetical protein